MSEYLKNYFKMSGFRCICVYFKKTIMKYLKSYYQIDQKINGLKDVPSLIMRLILAYGFYIPAKMKWANMEGIASWFEIMSYPLPVLNAYLAASTEALGVVLLIIGLGTRMISIPLIIVMIIAISTVHIGNGFNAGDNGSEIPLYYIIMLFNLIIIGPGRISIDYLISKRLNK